MCIGRDRRRGSGRRGRSAFLGLKFRLGFFTRRIVTTKLVVARTFTGPSRFRL